METISDPELGTETSLGRQGTVKVKTSVQWQASSGLSRTWLHPGPHPHPHSGQDLSVAIKKKKWGVCDDHASPRHTILQPTTGMLESGDVRAPYLYPRGTSALSPTPSPQPQPQLASSRPQLRSSLHPAQVLAVMGPSGSGKTTLLDAVSGRTKKDKVRGTVSFNGRADIPFAQRNRLLSYVAQEDSLLGVFTVAESLRFAVRFYHGYGTADTEALEAEALSLVGLESARDTIVGDIFRKGLSGGQKRRLSLAVELVKQPAVRTHC